MHVDSGIAAPSATARRNVAVVGSSGGGTVLLSNPSELLAAIEAQLARVAGGATISAAQFVCCDAPLDSAHGRCGAALWVVDLHRGWREPVCVLRGELHAVNERARELDASLAERVPKLDGVIAVSSDARNGGANAAVLRAAGAAKVPIVGTGGTSLSVAAAMYGCKLCGNAGGSVGTTSATKAIGVAASLAGAWGVGYLPAHDRRAAPWRSVVNECIPALVCVACCDALLALVGAAPQLRVLLKGVAAPAVGAVAALRFSGGVVGAPTAVLAGSVVGTMCNGSACAALVMAALFAQLAPSAVAECARRSAPATAASFLVGGALPALLGCAGFALSGPASAAAAGLRWVMHVSLARSWCAALVGALMSYGARRGWYHAYVLPLIALEHEIAALAALGALDAVCLCACGAGACAAQLAVPRRPTADGDVALACRGLLVNVACGDYVEACYPFLDRDAALQLATYAAAALGAAVSAGSRSTAYIPLPLAACIAHRPLDLLLGMCLAFVIPFGVGCAVNVRANAAAPKQRAA